MHTQPGGAQTDQSIRHRPVIRGRAGLIGGWPRCRASCSVWIPASCPAHWT
ncbi:hypothetical protein RAA17_07595 [Komagataeibacter rhaeticus]|nr:hypothetical protein [Komagataeibacter rhaeticus]